MRLIALSTEDIYSLGDSLFTMLFQDEHGGLQFLDRASGEFIDAVPKDGVLYMNIGDMFERVSNGELSVLKRLTLRFSSGCTQASIRQHCIE